MPSSTALGSVNMAEGYSWGPILAYKISKPALNMLTVQYALEYGKDGFTIFAVSPVVHSLIFLTYPMFHISVLTLTHHH